MTILYSLISRGAVVLCSHKNGEGNFVEAVRKILPNIPTKADAKTTYTSDSVSFHIVVENGLIYMCAADPDFGRLQPYAFLEDIVTRFKGSALASRAQFAADGELDRDFSNVLSQQMERFSRGDQDNVSKLRSQVDEVKGIMTQNIEKVLERGERLEDLIASTNELEAQSQTFQKTSRRVSRKMWWKNTKMTLCLIGVGIIALLVIILIILFSTGVLPPKHSNDNKTTPAP